MKPTTVVLALLWPLLSLAQSPAIWRCGPEGRSYSDAPCAGGQTLALTAPRPEADVGAAREVAQRERQLADALRRERHEREAQGARLANAPHPAATARRAAGVKAKTDSPQRPAHRAHPPRPADDGIWRAVVPATRRDRG
jgi:hypothetical protein